MAVSHDVVIAGGGPVGSALALALADGRRRIAVVEARAEPPAGEARAIALSEGSARLLAALGVWARLADDSVPIRRVEVSQRGYPGRTRIDAADEAIAALGHVVALGRLGPALAEAARAAPGVDWWAPARLTGVTREGSRLCLAMQTDGGADEVTAALAVGADGTASPLREALGIEARVHDYQQTALLTEVTTGGEAHTAHERFTGDGPLALLPGTGDRRTLIWTLKHDRIDAIAALDRDALGRAVQNRLGASLAPVRVQADPVTYPLRRTVADTLRAPRAVLVGNAARTLHPVAAQGFNLALRDVCALAEALVGVPDVGDASVLERWRRRRRADQWRTQAFTDVLARGFHGGGPLGGGARAGALLGLDTLPPARHALAAQSMGMLGGLPRVGAWQLRRRQP